MSDNHNAEGMVTRFERINPYVYVRNLPASLRYYVDLLGFDLYVETPTLGIVTRDGHQVHLVERPEDGGLCRVWGGVEDIQVLYDQYTQLGVKIRQGPTNYSWAYQMEVGDLDGNILTFDSGPLNDLSFQNQMD